MSACSRFKGDFMVSKREVANALDRLNGRIRTPPGVAPEVIDFIRSNRLAVFHEWPTGCWEVTENGRYYRAEHYVDEEEGY